MGSADLSEGFSGLKQWSEPVIYDRLVSILTEPRPVVQMGAYYGPEPRRMFIDAVRTAPPPVAAAAQAMS